MKIYNLQFFEIPKIKKFHANAKKLYIKIPFFSFKAIIRLGLKMFCVIKVAFLKL